MLLEVCVDSLESALAAIDGGASRLELCSALSEGGLTPSPGFLKILKEELQVKIPIFCMLRPRQGNDFCYSEEEMKIILYDLDILKENGSDGFVFGSLTPERKINIEQCRSVIKRAAGLPVTFHRAFDVTVESEMNDNCQVLQKLGFKRILTSGFRQTAEEGLPILKKLISEDYGIIIMPGAGITIRNLENILNVSKCSEVHASAKRSKEVLQHVSMGSRKDEVETVFVTDKGTVQSLVELAESCML